MANHSVLTGADLHEPKGIEDASAGQIYQADGAGSGAWASVSAGNAVLVSSASDFPSPSGGEIALADNTKYIIDDNITIGDTLVFGNNTGIVGNSVLHPTLTYSGSGIMLSGLNVNAYVADININAPDGLIFGFTESDGGLYSFFSKGVSVNSCSKIGIFDGMNIVNISEFGCFDADQGFSFAGADLRLITLRQILVDSTNATFEGIDLGNTTVNNLEFIDLIFNAPSGAVGIRGTADSFNISPGFVATVDRGTFTGGLTPLSGITPNDIRWSFFGNNDIRNNEAEALISLSGNTGVTTISATSTPVKVTGTWTTQTETKFENDSSGRVTYKGEPNTVAPVDAVLSVDPDNGTDQEIGTYIALNGSIISDSVKTATASSGDPSTITLMWQLELTTDDYLELFIENNTSTNNLVVVSAILRVN